jgi:hypothetical protein
MKDGVGSSFRVRICKTCCQGSSHIELGTYVDQESAILVNDVHEIIKGRHEKLTLLRKEDEPYLDQLTARRYDRNRGKDICSIVSILAEKQMSQENEKRSRSSSIHSLSSLVEAASMSYSSESPEVYSETSSNYGSGSKAYKKHPKFRAYTSDYATATGKKSGPESLKKDKAKKSMTKKGKHPRTATATSIVPALAANAASAHDVFAELIKSETHSAEGLGIASSSQSISLNHFRRPRGATISYSPYAPADPTVGYNPREGPAHVRTLNWLANLGDDEMAAAHLLSGLSEQVKANSSSCLKDSKSCSEEAGKSYSMAEGRDDSCCSSSADTETHTDTGDSETLTVPSGSPRRKADSTTTTGSSLCSDDEDMQAKLSAYVGGAKRPRASSVPELGSLMRASDYADMDEDSRVGSGGVLTNALRSKLRMTAMAVAKELHGNGAGAGYVGIYSPQERKLRIERFAAKRHKRVWTKKVKYDVRKNFADSRVRVKGRFIRKDEESEVKDVPRQVPPVEAH